MAMDKVAPALEALIVPLLAVLASLCLFGVFMVSVGTNPLEVYALLYKGGFGTWFSWQNTLQRAAPLLLTALCTAIPAHLGLIVIGGEGALVLGGLGATMAALALSGAPPLFSQAAMVVSGAGAGGAWVLLSGMLRHYRGVNETISSLLLNYVAIAFLNHMVEGPIRDPASLNKPSTAAIAAAAMVDTIPGTDVHWGLVWGVGACLVVYGALRYTVFGFASRLVGGNVRAARLVGLPVGALVLGACFLAGLPAGLAGMFEVAAVHGRANASLVAGYGYTGILVAFLARHHPLAIIPVAILLGGIGASGGLLQRRLGLPDAAVLVLQGVLFLSILASEAIYGRLSFLQPRGAEHV
jgi:simple sugar transport system permease protein